MTSAAQPGPGLPPVPVGATTVDDLTGALRELRAWAGNPSYAALAQRVARARLARGVPRSEAVPGRVTVYDCFRDGRRRLDMELVLDLVAALGAGPDERAGWRQAVRAVLLPGAVPVQARVVADPPVPRVIGRAPQRAQVVAAADGGPVVLTGMAGVGKTSLAVLAARELADRRDAEVLLLDLQGSSPQQETVDAGAAATALLQRLRPEEPVGDLAAVLAGLRGALRAGRYVVVLDDAASAEQVAPLLPDGGDSAVLVTSRRRLPDLPGAQEVLLDPLERGEGLELLAHSAGRPLPADGQSEALVDLAGGLPLALSVLGRRLAGQPDWPLADHLQAYRDRLERASLDEPVEAVLRVSYDALPDDQQQLLRMLTWHPTRTMGERAVEALADRSGPQLRPLLAGLVDAHLLRAVEDDRWELHELVRAFAVARSLEQDSPSQRRAGAVRVVESYLATACRAVAALHPASTRDWYWLPERDRAPEEDEDRARRYLAEESANLAAAALWASEHDLPALTVRLSIVVAPHLFQRGGVDETFQLHLAARVAATRTEDELAMALTERNLGQTLLRAGRFSQAEGYLDRALAHYEAAGHQDGQRTVLNAMGYLASSVGDHGRAVAIFTELSRRQERDDERWAVATSNLAVALVRKGERSRGVDLLLDVAREAAEHGWAEREQWALSNVSGLLCEEGRADHGRQAAERALRLATEAGDEVGRAYALANLAVTQDAGGDGARAVATALEALEAARTLEAPDLEASVLNHLGEFAHTGGDHRQAHEWYAEALAVAERIGEASEARRAREGLAQLEVAVG